MAAPAAQPAADPAPSPFECKLVKFDLEGHFHYTFTVDLELDLADPRLNEVFGLEEVPLVGKWKCACWMDAGNVCISVRHGDLPAGIFGSRTRYRLRLFRVHGSACRLLEASSSWHPPRPRPKAIPDSPGKAFTGFKVTVSRSVLEAAATRSDGEYNIERHRSYRLKFEIESLGSQPTCEAEVLIRRMPGEPAPSFCRPFTPLTESGASKGGSLLGRCFLPTSFFVTLAPPRKSWRGATLESVQGEETERESELAKEGGWTRRPSEANSDLCLLCDTTTCPQLNADDGAMKPSKSRD